MKPRRGRPPRSGSAATHRIDVRLTDSEFEAIARFADAHGNSLADGLRFAGLLLAGYTDGFQEDDDDHVVEPLETYLTPK